MPRIASDGWPSRAETTAESSIRYAPFSCRIILPAALAASPNRSVSSSLARTRGGIWTSSGSIRRRAIPAALGSPKRKRMVLPAGIGNTWSSKRTNESSSSVSVLVRLAWEVAPNESRTADANRAQAKTGRFAYMVSLQERHPALEAYHAPSRPGR